MVQSSHARSVGLLTRLLSQLRFPWLFTVVAVLFGIDMIVPDIVPFIDELLLGSATLLLGSWKRRKAERTNVIDVPDSDHKHGARGV
ncbi:MAG: DUF6116 family protein [Planctomycetaceae bacterium]